MKIDNNSRVGTTESGEVAFNLDAFERLYRANIIITKRLTDKLIEKLIEHKDKIILHLTCTGMGSTLIEPFVPTYEETFIKFRKLIDDGFPIEHVVLRIDPIVPSDKGIGTAMAVLRRFGGLGIKRVRISFLDNYKHVRERFKEKGIKELYDGKFHASLGERLGALDKIKECAEECGFEYVEACGEPNIESLPCVSERDIEILGLSGEIELVGSANQRSSCGCPQNKSEILRVKPQRCEHKCLYCYWRD